MSNVFIGALQFLNDYQTRGQLGELGSDKGEDALVEPLRKLQEAIAILQECEAVYHKRIAKERAYGVMTLANRTVPMREFAHQPRPKPFDVVKVVADNKQGFRTVNYCDWDPDTQELYKDA